ncbi:Uncharacterised protein [Serratia fonticola]|uniref:Uncharacterized protein n=1 Tax=Serratia fonticola TaxID=47917 RepID=A0A4U9U3B7_SERFO|nr:Uncharacterised protein [Serratia fonticola]
MDEIGLILMMASTNSCEQERSILSYSPHVCFSAGSLQFYLSQCQKGFYSSYGARFFHPVCAYCSLKDEWGSRERRLYKVYKENRAVRENQFLASLSQGCS